MPRRKRSYLPGGAFHITARTHCREYWFEDLRSEIVEIITIGVSQTDAQLVAFGIMTNHFHLVVHQGNAPLSQLMQPVCQRTAYAVHRRLDRKGYVMGYRYHDTPCCDESHLRNAIMYTHRNPVEAGMCENASDYEWSSDLAYRSPSPSAIRSPSLRPAIELFSSGRPGRTAHQDYADYYAWYDACKRLGPDDAFPYSPGVTAGDEYWLNNFGKVRAPDRYPKLDLRDVVKRALADVSPDFTLAQLRAGGLARPFTAIRTMVIERALRAGHRRVDIAAFLNTSDSTVSRVTMALARQSQP